MGAIASQITSPPIVYSTVSGADKKKTSMLRVTGLYEGIHRGPVNSPHKGPVTLRMFPFDDVIMILYQYPRQYAESYVLLFDCRARLVHVVK